MIGYVGMQEIEWENGSKSNKTNITILQISINMIQDFDVGDDYNRKIIEKRIAEDLIGVLM